MSIFQRPADPQPEPERFDPAQFASDLANLMEGLGAVRDACTGYRTQLEQDGWSPTAAEQAALQLHFMLMGSLRGGGR